MRSTVVVVKGSGIGSLLLGGERDCVFLYGLGRIRFVRNRIA